MVSLELLVDVLAPHNCLGCGAEGKIICAWCASDVFPAVPSRCYICKRITREFSVCASCRSHSKLRRVWISTGYGGVAKQLLWRYKFGRARAAVEPITQSLHEMLPVLQPGTIISFVPTATNRLRLRGYDQAELIARELAHLRGLPCARLVSRLSQSRQVGSNKKQRETQLRNAFVVVKPHVCENSTILVIDDVVTTGSTLEAVAKRLRAAGAKHVDAAVFAQKQ